MDKLKDEEVIHVANLARIGITDEEIKKYSIDLKKLMDDIDKIKDVKLKNENSNILVTPTDEFVTLREDSVVNEKNFNEFKNNLSSSIGNFVRVPVNNND